MAAKSKKCIHKRGRMLSLSSGRIWVSVNKIERKMNVDITNRERHITNNITDD